MRYLLTLFCFFVLPLCAAQATFEVQMLFQEGKNGPELYFEPVGLHIQPGDTVRFVAATPHHNVVAYHAQQGKSQRVPEGVPPFSSRTLPVGDTWNYTFDVEGTYDLWCAPHELTGMAMRIVVGEPGGPAEEPVTDFGPFGVFGASGKVLNDAALASGNIVSVKSVSWADLNPASKVPPPMPGISGAHGSGSHGE